MKVVRYVPFILLILLPIVIGTAVAETNEPEAIESLSNWDSAQKLTGLFNNTPNGAQRPVVAVAPNGDIIVAYLKQQSADGLDVDPFFLKSTDGGQNWSDPARIQISAAISRQVHVAFDNNNIAHAVWTEADKQLWYGSESEWSINGSMQLFSGDILIESPKIAIGKNGVLHVVWTQVDFSGQDVYYSRSSNGGATWTSPVNVSASPASSESPAIAIDSDDRPNIVWEEQVGGSVYKVSFSRRKLDGSGDWTTPLGISNLVTAVTSAREPDIAISGSQIMVVFEDRVSLSQQSLYYMECITGCNSLPLRDYWRARPATVQAFGAKDSDPTFLGPKVASVGQCRTVFFSGITGNTSTNNEKVRVGDSCSGFASNPIITAIEDSLGTNDRAIKPSVAVLNNWLVFVAYEHKGPSRSDIYLVQNQPAVYLPIVVK